MAGDRSAIWVVRGHQRPETTGTEIAFCSFTSACAAVASGTEWSSISAARRSLGPTSGSWERVLSSARERVVKLEAALAALGDDCGPEVVLLQCVEECKTSQLSQCEQFVAGLRRGWRRATRRGSVWFQSCRKGESRRARLRKAAAMARNVPRSTASSTRRGSGSCLFGGDGEDARDALLAIRPGSCGAFPLPGKPLGIVNQCTLPGRWRQSRQIFFSTRNHRAQDQYGAERFDRARCEKKSSVERTNHIHGGQQGQLSKRLSCFEDAQVDLERQWQEGSRRGVSEVCGLERRLTQDRPEGTHQNQSKGET